jgi:hypothetical protein
MKPVVSIEAEGDGARGVAYDVIPTTVAGAAIEFELVGAQRGQGIEGQRQGSLGTIHGRGGGR